MVEALGGHLPGMIDPQQAGDVPTRRFVHQVAIEVAAGTGTLGVRPAHGGPKGQVGLFQQSVEGGQAAVGEGSAHGDII